MVCGHLLIWAMGFKFFPSELVLVLEEYLYEIYNSTACSVFKRKSIVLCFFRFFTWRGVCCLLSFSFSFLFFCFCCRNRNLPQHLFQPLLFERLRSMKNNPMSLLSPPGITLNVTWILELPRPVPQCAMICSKRISIG